MDLTDFLRQCVNMASATNNTTIIPKIRLNDTSTSTWAIMGIHTETTRKGKAIKNFLELEGIGGRIELPVPRDSLYFDDKFLNFVVKNSLQLPEIITELDPVTGELLYFMEIEYKQLREPPILVGAIYRTKRGKIRPLLSIKHVKDGMLVNNKLLDDNPRIVYYFINYSNI